ncbi:putative ribonuclease H-like domain-containing protein [Tanacetum coccineum]
MITRPLPRPSILSSICSMCSRGSSSKISSGRKKSWGSNSGDGGNTGDEGKMGSGVIGAYGGRIGDSLLVALYACMTFIYGSSWKGEMVSEAERSLDKSSERSKEVFPGEAGEIDQGLGSTSGIRAFALRNFDLEVMEFETAQNTTTAKLPILKLENGNSWVSVPVTSQENGTSIKKMTVPVTAEEKICKKNDVKARSLLLMALPNEHQLTFSQYTDAKTMFAAMETRFGGNEATKKTQKALLKQQYENFNASSSESLDSIFNRLQKLVSRLAILGVVITSEDINSKFFRSLPPEWNTHVVVWMNKLDIETISIYDLYNNFKIVEQDVKKYVGAKTGTQNLAFMTASSTSSTNNVNTANPEVIYAFLENQPKRSQLVHKDLEQIHDDDLEEMDLKWQLALLSMRARRFYQRTGKKIMINGSDTGRFDKSKVECFNCHKMGHFARECRAPRNKDGQYRYQDNSRNQESSKRTVNVEDTSSKEMLAIDGIGFD